MMVVKNCERYWIPWLVDVLIDTLIALIRDYDKIFRDVAGHQLTFLDDVDEYKKVPGRQPTQ